MPFQSTLSVRRATLYRLHLNSQIFYFNPRSPWGERLQLFIYFSSSIYYFNPRSPWGERLVLPSYLLISNRDFNPRSPWGERRVYCFIGNVSTCISIHALREESDTNAFTKIKASGRFQSTLSVRRATALEYPLNQVPSHFNPRSPWGERHQRFYQNQSQR